MPAHIGRRQFVSLLGGAVPAWPFVMRAQQSPMPVIGYLDPRSPETLADRLRVFRQGLKQIAAMKSSSNNYARYLSPSVRNAAVEYAFQK